MPSAVERIQSVVLLGVALAIGVSVVHREFFAPAPAAAATPGSVQFVSSWRDALPAGIDLGNPQAPIKIVEFSDLQCPFCRQFNQTVQEITATHRPDVDVVFVSFPLPIHRFANAAAHVADCAAGFGRFPEMVQALFRTQDSLGIKPWSAYAKEAGISDTTRINTCARDTARVKRIQDGLAAGEHLHLTGTPTVLVNGWRFNGTPTKDHLLEVIDSLTRGRTPDGKRLRSAD